MQPLSTPSVPRGPRPSSHTAKALLNNRLVPQSMATGKGGRSVIRTAGTTEEQAKAEPNPTIEGALRIAPRPPQVSSTRITSNKSSFRHNVTGINSYTASVAIAEMSVVPAIDTASIIASQEHPQPQSSQAYTKPAHENMEMLVAIGGWAAMAHGLFSQGTEFTYLLVDGEDPYKFSIADRVPTEADSYAKLSLAGISRGGRGADGEVTSFDAMGVEHQQFLALRRLKVFGEYRLWKSMVLWKTMVKQLRSARCLQNLLPRFSRIDPMIHAVLSRSAAFCCDVRAIPVLQYENRSYELADFLAHQHRLQLAASNQFTEMLADLVHFLCFEGDKLAMSSLIGLPSCVSAVTRAPRPDVVQNTSFITASYDEFYTASLAASEEDVGQMGNLGTDTASAFQPSFALGHVGRRMDLAHEGASRHQMSTLHNVGNSKLLQNSQAASMYSGMGLSYTEKGAIRQKCRLVAVIFRVIDFMLRDSFYGCVEASLQHQVDILKLAAARAEGILGSDGEDYPHVKNSFFPRLIAKPENLVKHGPVDSAKVPDVGVFRLSMVLDKIDNLMRRGNRHPLQKESNTDIEQTEMDFSDNSTDGGYDSQTEREIASSMHAKRGDIIISKHSETFALSTDPPISRIMEGFEETIKGALDLGTHTTSLLSHTAFQGLFLPIADSVKLMSLDDCIHGDIRNSVNILANEATTLLRNCAENCLAYMHNYTFLCDLYQEHLHLQMDTSFQARLQQMDTDAIGIMLDNIDSELVRCQQIPNHAVFGTFSIQLKDARCKVQEKLNESKVLLHGLLPRIYTYHAEAFYTDITRLSKVIATRFQPATPNALEDYVMAVECYRKTVQDKEVYQHRYLHAQSISSLIEDTTIAHNAESEELSRSIGPAWRHLEDLLSVFEQRIPQNAELCAAEIRGRASSVMLILEESSALLNSGMVLDPNSDADAVIDTLFRSQAQLRSACDQGNLLDRQQNITCCRAYDSEPAETLRSRCESELALWILVQTARMLYRDAFCASSFDSETLNVDLIYSTLIGIRKQMAQEVQVPNPKVCAYLSNLLSEVDRVIPVLAMLQSPVLQALHHEQLNLIFDHALFSTAAAKLSTIESIDTLAAASEIGYDRVLPDTQELSPALQQGHNMTALRAQSGSNLEVANKRNANVRMCAISEFLDPKKGFNEYQSTSVTALFQSAAHEYHVYEKFSTIKTEVEGLFFEIFYDSRNKISITLNFKVLESGLTDAALTLEGLLQSVYNANVLSSLQRLLEELHACIHFTAEALKCQQDYLELRRVFANPRSSRQLSHCISMYKIADEIYRHLTQLLKNELNVLRRVSAICPHHSSHTEGSLSGVVAELRAALDNVRTEVQSYANKLCITWPKWHLLDFATTLQILSSPDSFEAFKLARVTLFPVLNDLIGDDADELHSSIIGCISSGERLLFAKEVNSRQSVAEWMQSLNFATSARLRDDVRNIMAHKAFQKGNFGAWLKEVFMYSAKDQTLVVPTEQARISCLHVKFWEKIDSAFTQEEGGGSEPRVVFAEHREYLLQQISSVSQLLSDFEIKNNSGDDIDSANIIRQTLANTLIVFTSQRDVLAILLKEPSLTASSFIFQAQLRKTWKADSGLSVVIAGEVSRYGYAYQGFGPSCTTHGIFITPLTQRCFYTIAHSFRASRSYSGAEVLVLHGSGGLRSRGIMRSLASETGFEMVDVNCERHGVNAATEVQNALKSTIGCFHWLSVHGLHSQSDFTLSLIWGALQEAVHALDTYASATRAGLLRKEEPLQASICNSPIFMPSKPLYLPLMALITPFPSFISEIGIPDTLRKRLHVLDLHTPLQVISLECLLLSHVVPPLCARGVARRLFGLMQHAVSEGLFPADESWAQLMYSVNKTQNSLNCKFSSDWYNVLGQMNTDSSISSASEEASIAKEIAKEFLRRGVCTAMAHSGNISASGVFDVVDSPRRDWSHWDIMHHLSTIQDMISLFLLPSQENGGDGTGKVIPGQNAALSDLMEYLPTSLRGTLSAQMLATAHKQLTALMGAGGRRATRIEHSDTDGDHFTQKIQMTAHITPANDIVACIGEASYRSACLVVGAPGVGKSKAIRDAAQIIDVHVTEINPYASASLQSLPLDLLIAEAHGMSSNMKASLLHVVLNSSAELDSLLYPLNDTIMQNGVSKVKVVYELCDTRYATPSSLCSQQLVLIPYPEHSAEDVLLTAVRDICQTEKPDFHELLMYCVRAYVVPCYQYWAGNQASTVIAYSFPAQCLKMLHSLLRAFGIIPDYNAKVHCRSVQRAVLFYCFWTFGTRPKFVTAKFTSDQRIAFDTWFKSHFFNELNGDDTGEFSLFGTDAKNEDSNPVFPVIAEGATVYDMFLVPSERPIKEAGVHLIWGKLPSWVAASSNGARIVPAERLRVLPDKKLTHIFCDASSRRSMQYDMSRLCVPTTTSIALSFIQACSLRASKSIKPLPLVISGAEGSGKRVLVSQILYNQEGSTMDEMFAVGRDKALSEDAQNASRAHTISERWVALCGDSITARSAITAMQKAIQKAQCALTVNTTDGILVVEDLYLGKEQTEAESPDMMSFLRWLSPQQNETMRQTKLIGGMCEYLVLSCKLTNSAVAEYGTGQERLLGVSWQVEVSANDHQSVHAALLSALCPSLRQDLCVDLVTLTHNVARNLQLANVNTNKTDSSCEMLGTNQINDEVLQYFSVVNNLFQTQTESDISRFIIQHLANGLMNMPHFTTNEVLRLWDRIMCCDMAAHQDPRLRSSVEEVVETVSSNSDLFIVRDFHNLLRRERRTRVERENQRASRLDSPDQANANDASSVSNCDTLILATMNAKWNCVPIFEAEGLNSWAGIRSWESPTLSNLLPRVPCFRADVLRVQAFVTSLVTPFHVQTLLVLGSDPQNMNLSQAIVHAAGIDCNAEYRFHLVGSPSHAHALDRHLSCDSINLDGDKRTVFYHVHLADMTRLELIKSNLQRLFMRSSGCPPAVITFETFRVARLCLEILQRLCNPDMSMLRFLCTGTLSDLARSDEDEIRSFSQFSCDQMAMINSSKRGCANRDFDPLNSGKDQPTDFFTKLQLILSDDSQVYSKAAKANSFVLNLPALILESSERQKKFTRRMVMPEGQSKANNDKAVNSRRSLPLAKQQGISSSESSGEFRSAAPFVSFLQAESSSFNFCISTLSRRFRAISSVDNMRSFLLNLAAAISCTEAITKLFPCNKWSLFVREKRKRDLCAFLDDFSHIYQETIHTPSVILHNHSEESWTQAAKSNDIVQASMKLKDDLLLHRFETLSAFESVATYLTSVNSNPEFVGRHRSATRNALESLSLLPNQQTIHLPLEHLLFPASLFYALSCCTPETDDVCCSEIMTTDACMQHMYFKEGQVRLCIIAGSLMFNLHIGSELKAVRAGGVKILRPPSLINDDSGYVVDMLLTFVE